MQFKNSVSKTLRRLSTLITAEPTRTIFLAYLIWKTLCYLVALIAKDTISLQTNYIAQWDFGMHVPYLIWAWGGFDGMHYMEIARNGYHTYLHPFFPLYPIFIRSIVLLFHVPFIVSAQVISNIALIVALYVVYYCYKLDSIPGKFSNFLFVLFIFPTSFFLQAVYNDSLFLLLATTVILLTRKKKYRLAGLIGFFATLTRLNGLALFFYMILEYALGELHITDQWKLKNIQHSIKEKFSVKNIWKSGIYGSLLIPLSFISYLVYINFVQQNWETLFSSMSIWNQQNITIPLQTIYRYIKILFTYEYGKLTYWIALFEVFFFSFYCFALYYSFKKIRLSYWVFILCSLTIPALTGTFQGMPRYALHLYPLFVVIYIMLKSQSRKIKLVYFIVSLSLLILFVMYFTRGYFIA